MRLLGLCLAVLSCAACAEANRQEATTVSGSGGGGPTTTSNTGGAGVGGFQSSGGAAGAPGESVLYVHSNTTLFTGDPADPSLALQQVGDFDCIGTGNNQSTSMTDIGVDRDGQPWAISTSFLYRLEISASTVHCADTVPLNNPNDIRFYALTFAPIGVLDPNDELLVAGNSAGELWQIDKSGNLSQRGTFGPVPANDGHGHSYDNAGQPWELSGDIVFFENNGNPIGFATVRDCPNPPSTQGCNNVDTLIEIDVPMLATATTQSVTKSVRGLLVPGPSCNDPVNGYGRVYGIAGYQGKVLGFSRNFGDGFSLAIDNIDGTACAIETFPGIEWAGAGITTLAPVIAPPK